MMLITASEETSISNVGEPVVADGSVLFTFGGSISTRKRLPTITIMARSDSAPFVQAHYLNGFGRFIVALAEDDEYYFSVNNPDSGVIYLAVVDYNG